MSPQVFGILAKHPHHIRNHGAFAQGALVTGGGGIVDCAAAVKLSPVTSSDAIPLIAAGLLAHGATVPDSVPDDGVPLGAHGIWASFEYGSIIDVGSRAQGAVVPTVGVLDVGRGGFVRSAAVLGCGRPVATWFAHGA